MFIQINDLNIHHISAFDGKLKICFFEREEDVCDWTERKAIDTMKQIVSEILPEGEIATLEKMVEDIRDHIESMNEAKA